MSIIISQVRLDVLKYFKEHNFEADYDDVLQHFNGIHSHGEIESAWDWILDSKWFISDGLINPKGKAAINVILGEKEKKEKRELEVSEKQINAKWWDRFIDNGYKLIGIPILFWTAYLQYTQVGNSADIRRLQEKLKGDSIQFSTTLRDLQNQSVQHSKTLQSNSRQFEKYDSLLNDLKVKK